MKIERTLEDLDDADIQYVFTHKWRGFPNLKPDNEVNLLINEDQYDESLEIFDSNGFNTLTSTEKEGIVDAFVSNPSSSLLSLATSPVETTRKALQIYHGDSGRTVSNKRLVTECSLKTNGIGIKVANHLGYVPYLWEEKKLRITPELEREMLKQRDRVQGPIYVADLPHELIHLICDGVFNHEGEFPHFHKERCEELWNEIQQSEEDREYFENCLDLVFYQASSVVLECLSEKNYEQLLPKLMCYTKY